MLMGDLQSERAARLWIKAEVKTFRLVPLVFLVRGFQGYGTVRIREFLGEAAFSWRRLVWVRVTVANKQIDRFSPQLKLGKVGVPLPQEHVELERRLTATNLNSKVHPHLPKHLNWFFYAHFD